MIGGGSSYRAVVRLRSVQYIMDITMWVFFVGGALYAWVHRLIGAGDFVMITALTSSLLQTAYNLGSESPISTTSWVRPARVSRP